jgi:hypothetical protein
MTSSLSRRSVVAGAAAALGTGFALGGCTGSAHRPASVSAYTGDFRLVALGVALENQAIGVYRALLAAVRKGRLGGPGSVPALVSLAQTCLAQHFEHADRWNAILRSGHKPVISDVPLAGHESILRAADAAVTVGQAAVLAMDVESQAEQTYVAAIGHLDAAGAVAAAASIAPVEAMHAAVLRLIAGEYPTPAGFAGRARAASPRELLV